MMNVKMSGPVRADMRITKQGSRLRSKLLLWFIFISSIITVTLFFSVLFIAVIIISSLFLSLTYSSTSRLLFPDFIMAIIERYKLPLHRATPARGWELSLRHEDQLLSLNHVFFFFYLNKFFLERNFSTKLRNFNETHLYLLRPARDNPTMLILIKWSRPEIERQKKKKEGIT